MVSRKTIANYVLAGCFVITALPAHAFPLAHGTFNPSNEDADRLKETNRARIILASDTAAEKYPYPSKALVMTEEMWLKSTKAVEFGTSSWFDAEVVRHRAEVEKHPPAMDFLAWMYEEGRGLEQDSSKAFTWYERAKMAGKTDLRGSSTKIFERLSLEDRYIVKLQQAEDIQVMKAAGKPVNPDVLKQVNLHVLELQRGSVFYKPKRAPSPSKGKRAPAPY